MSETKIDSPSPQIRLGDKLSVFTGAECMVFGVQLYHGSANAAIKQFELNQDVNNQPATLADGLFFAIDANTAAAYARYRAHTGRGIEPTVYQVQTGDHLRLANLDNVDQKDTLFYGFQTYLFDLEPQTVLENIIRSGSIDSLVAVRNRLGTQALTLALRGGTSYLFGKFMSSQGYNGLIATEGGEGRGAVHVEPHKSVVIFNPSDVSIVDKYPAK